MRPPSVDSKSRTAHVCEIEGDGHWASSIHTDDPECLHAQNRSGLGTLHPRRAPVVGDDQVRTVEKPVAVIVEGQGFHRGCVGAGPRRDRDQWAE